MQANNAASDRQISRQLGMLALQLEELDDKLTERSRNPRTAAQLRTSLNGDTGEAIGNLDVDTANRLLDGLAGIKKQLASVENKVDTANEKLGAIDHATECTAATTANLSLAVKGRNVATVVTQLRCRPELLADRFVRGHLSDLFSSEEFRTSDSLREAVAGLPLDFTSDIWTKDNPGLIGYPYLLTPIGRALNAALAGGLEVDISFPSTVPADPKPLNWLLSKANRSDFEAYPLLAHMLAFRFVEVTKPCYMKYSDFSMWDSDIQTIQRLRRAGMSVDAQDFIAYRHIVSRLLELNWQLPHDLGAINGNQLDDDPNARRTYDCPDPRWIAPMLRAATALAPDTDKLRLALAEREYESFATPRLQALEQEIGIYQGALDHPVVDEKWVSDSALTGHWKPIALDPSRLRDDQAIELEPGNARDHYLVGGIRTKLAGYRAARAKLLTLKDHQPTGT